MKKSKNSNLLLNKLTAEQQSKFSQKQRQTDNYSQDITSELFQCQQVEILFPNPILKSPKFQLKLPNFEPRIYEILLFCWMKKIIESFF